MDTSKSSTDSCCATPGSKCSIDSQDVSDEYSDVSSSVSSDEMSIFSEDIDDHEDTEEMTGTSLEPYQFKPIDANASDTDRLTEDESSSDEELLGKLPNDMSWYDHSTTTCQLIIQFLQVSLWQL